MKPIINAIYKAALGLGLSVVMAGNLLAADGPKVEKKKTFEKRVTISKNQKVEIENKFGNVTVTNASGNELYIKVTATVNAATEKKAQEILDKIRMEFSQSSSISYETDISSSGSNSRTGNNKMEINVELSLPQENPLEIENSFGNTLVPDRSGLTDLEQKFGDLKTGKLNQAKEISVEFGSLTAALINGGKIEAKYSDIRIDALSGKVNSVFEFCKTGKINFTNDLTGLNIKTAYSDLNIGIPSGFDGNFMIRTSFGEFVNKSGIKILSAEEEDRYGPNFDKDFQGVSGNGNCKVNIKTSFGTLKFN